MVQAIKNQELPVGQRGGQFGDDADRLPVDGGDNRIAFASDRADNLQIERDVFVVDRDGVATAIGFAIMIQAFKYGVAAHRNSP